MIEVRNRIENPLLGRVEIEFAIQHAGQPTPDRKTMRDQASSLEPGSDSSLVVLKHVNTRFGRSETTGLALIYSDIEHARKEPVYIRNRFALDPSDGSSPEPVTKAVPKTSPEAEASSAAGSDGDGDAEEE